MMMKYLSKNKEERIQQLQLLIHNCNVYGIKSEIKEKYINELNKLENEE